MTTEENTTIPEKNQLVTKDHFSTVRIELEELKKNNESMVFDYETAKGEKEVRSYIYKLRQSKSVVKKIHQDAKAEALAIGKKLDADKRELTSEIEEMIDIHDKPLREKKEREEREAAEKLAEEQYNSDFDEALHMHDIFKREEALRIAEEKIAKEKAEQEAKAEAERLEKERIERERKLQEQAAEKAKIEAERKAQAEKEESERREREAKEAQQRAEQAAMEAKIKAEKEAEEARIRAKIEAENAEKKRLADIKAAEEKAEIEKKAAILEEQRKQAEKEVAQKAEAERLARIEAERQADLNHRKKINNESLDSLKEIGIGHDDAIKIISEIAKGNIKNIHIKY